MVKCLVCGKEFDNGFGPEICAECMSIPNKKKEDTDEKLQISDLIKDACKVVSDIYYKDKSVNTVLKDLYHYYDTCSTDEDKLLFRKEVGSIAFGMGVTFPDRYVDLLYTYYLLFGLFPISQDGSTLLEYPSGYGLSRYKPCNAAISLHKALSVYYLYVATGDVKWYDSNRNYDTCNVSKAIKSRLFTKQTDSYTLNSQHSVFAKYKDDIAHALERHMQMFNVAKDVNSKMYKGLIKTVEEYWEVQRLCYEIASFE